MPQAVLVVEFRPVPALFDEVIDDLKVRVPETLDFPGCCHVSCAVSEDRRDILVYEIWESRAAMEKYLDWRASRGDLGRFSDRIEEQLRFQVFDITAGSPA